MRHFEGLETSARTVICKCCIKYITFSIINFNDYTCKNTARKSFIFSFSSILILQHKPIALASSNYLHLIKLHTPYLSIT